MDKKKYFAFVGVCGKLSVVTAALIAVLFMSQPSRADFGLIDSTILRNISDSLDKLANNVGDLVAVEREKNELLKSIRNKLSDLAVIQSYNSHELYTRYAESDKDSGFKSIMLHNLTVPSKTGPIYYYFNDEMEKHLKKDGDNE